VRACPACQHRSARSVGAIDGFEMRRCTDCATVFTATLPSTPEEAHDYSTYYEKGNLEVPAFIERRLDQLVAGFDKYRRRNRWLDVGCGAGALMRAAAERGWTATGTEVSTRAADAVRSPGFDVRLGELETLSLEQGGFDVVSAVEVLEHVSDPDTLIGTARQLLRPGGALYMTTPNGRGIAARLLRTHWSVMSPPEHLQLFSTKGLKSLVTRVGFEIVRLRAHAVNPHELFAALRSSNDAEQPFERVPSAYELNESLDSSRAGRAAKAAVNGGLSVLRLGDTLKITAHAPG
jgi:SAM-dependent methyltransferase